VLVLAILRPKQEQWTGVVMAAVLCRPRALDQLDAMVEAIEIDEDRSSADAVGSGRLPAHEGVADGAVGSAGRSRGARLMTALTFSSR
jgi:hypothetical protein